MAIIKTCEQCGDDFSVKPYRKNSARFCSSKCWTTSNESKSIVGRAMKLRHNLNPVNGDSNPNWRGGIVPESKLFLMRIKWKGIKEDALYFYGRRCKFCGRTERLHVHHIVPRRNGGTDELKNLEVLCSHCHPSVEKNRELAVAIFKKCSFCSGKMDCLQPDCPLYSFMPYKGAKEDE